MYVFTQSLQLRQDVTQGQFFSLFEFSVFLLDWFLYLSNRAQFPNYLPIAQRRKEKLMSFLRALV